VTGIALGHHVGWLKHRVGDLRHGQLLVVGLLSRDDGGIRGKHKVDTGVWHKIGLELRDIDVEGTIESERGSQRGHNLGNQSVQVGVGWALDVQVAAAHIVQGFVIKTEGAISVLQQRVGGQHVVVWLDDGGSDLGSRGGGEGELGLAAIVNRQTLQQKRTETRAGTTTSGVEDHESLETSAVVSQLADSVKHKVDDLLADGVVTTSVVVGSIFLTGDDLLGVIELAVGTSADFIAHTWLKIDVDGTGDVLASTSLGEEGVEGIITSTDGLVGGHLTIGLDAVLEAVKLPAGVSGLDTALTNMNRKTLTHFE
jgi:hypothetical protein